MVLRDGADWVLRQIEGAQSEVSELLFEPVTRLGVTGLSRAGKTVFITSLVANLMDRGRMNQMRAVAEGRISAAYLEPQPDDDVPRFQFETHRGALYADPPHWPASTRAISQLRLSLRTHGGGLLSGFTGARASHLDIVDYPGEWLLDLSLIDKGYADWSREVLALAEHPARAGLGAEWRALMAETAPGDALDETRAQALATAFAAYLQESREAGFSNITPGRFLLPGDLEGSPALTFAPLPPGAPGGAKSLFRAFERRYDAYRRLLVKPFFRDHFARIDRQVVLVDLLAALDAGPAALEDLRASMAAVLSAFRPGRNTWLSGLLGKRVDRILFAATKADHIHHSQHARLAGLMQALVREAADRAQYRGAAVEAMAIAALRATVEQEVTRGGREIGVVRGRQGQGAEAVVHPGGLPDDPTRLLAAARSGAETWPEGLAYSATRFLPPILSAAPGEGPPHLRLDRAAEFLLGDRL
ncbi:MAG: YcjX family protein [Pseudomonadota bacterium]